MGMAVGGKGGVQHDINVTPLIDVVLVLLIIFMVLTPLMQKAHQVNLPAPPDPSITVSQPQPAANQLIVSMDKDKALSLNQDPVTMADLPKRIKDIMSTKNDKIAFFKCDASVRYSDAMAVMDVLRGNGAERIGIITEELKKEAAEAAGVSPDALTDGAAPAPAAPAAP